MTTPRPLPWTALFDAIGASRFEEIRTAMRHDRVDAANRDEFLMVASAGGLLREMIPPEASADAVLAYGALLHMLFLLWDAGWPVATLDRPMLDRALADFEPLSHPPTAPGVVYVQLPERVVWAAPAPGEPHEPLDGCFVSLRASRASVLAVLGFRADREGLTTIAADALLPLAPPSPRPDGAPPFSSALPSGDRAGLRSVVTPQELLALALLARAASAA